MAKMRRVCRRLMFQVVPCTSKRSMRTESHKDIEEILREKLATIIEEPDHEIAASSPMGPRMLFVIKKQGRKKMCCRPKVNKRLRELFFLPHFNIRDSYALFITGFASKGTFGGLLQ